MQNPVKYNLAVIIFYALTGFLGLMLAVPPGYATAIWPPSGIALGFVLVWGLTTLPGIFIGSLLLNFYVTSHNASSADDFFALSTGLITGTGAVLQAFIGWWLIKYFVQLNNPLHLPKDILLSALLTGPVSCIVSATFSNVGLYLLGVIPPENVLTSWITWWIGDSIGVLIFTPVILITCAKPEKLWRSRFIPILIPLCVTFIIVLLAHIFYSNAEIKRVQSKFVELTRYKLNSLADKLHLTTEIGKEMALFFAMEPNISNKDFQNIGSLLLKENSLIQSILWVPRVLDLENFRKKYPLESTDIITKKNYLSKNKTEHFPVLYSISRNANNFQTGVSSNINIEQLLKHNSQNNMVFPIILPNNGALDRVFIVSPAYREGKNNGYILLQINLLKLFNDTFHQFLRYSSVSISRNSNMGSHFELYEKSAPMQSRSIKTSLNFKLAGEPWHFNATSSPYFISEEYSWQVWLSLATTLFFCVLMNIILFILYGQRYLIQYLVEARTIQLQTEKAKNKLLLNATGEGILWIDLEYKIAFINPAAEKLLGYKSEELKDESIYKILVEKIIKDISPPIESLTVYRAIHEKTVIKIKEAVFWKKDHSYFWVEYTCIPIIIDNTVNGVAIIFSDISERLENENKLMNMAHIDPLTKLPNRLSFFEFLDHAIARAQRGKKHFSVCFIDVDNFKYINDTFGHVYGDKLLTILPEKIKPHLRDSDYFARIGGDEFGLIFEEAYKINDLNTIFSRILSAFDYPIKIDDKSLKASLSIGIAIYPKNGTDYETLLKNADSAMYQSKELGKSTFSFYSEKANEKILKYNQIEAALHKAIKEKSYGVYYQPLLHTGTKKIVGVEALLRWGDEELKNLPLVESLLIAEDRGIIYELGKLVLQQAFAEYQELAKYRPNLRLAVNTSIKQIGNPGFYELIQTLLNTFQINANQIYLEITETSFIKNSDNIINNMKRLSNLGIRFALDDFGIGYSSIHLLKKLPISFIKIDRSFIKDLEKNSDDATIVLTTIQLSHGLGIKSIAEGVENEEQLKLLKKWGCNIIQGFYFAPPMPLNELVSWMKNHELALKDNGNSLGRE